MESSRNALCSGFLGCGGRLWPLLLGAGLLVLATRLSAAAQAPASTQVVRLAQLEIYPA